ncbi:hypothetical protein BGY98DRAFT_683803 [Russula aff. rugulosa BPL654]|nr:hypothetical protein BGY98DRAFT_683803 [Russula aff. rugulosa BPL654]
MAHAPTQLFFFTPCRLASRCAASWTVGPSAREPQPRPQHLRQTASHSPPRQPRPDPEAHLPKNIHLQDQNAKLSCI